MSRTLPISVSMLSARLEKLLERPLNAPLAALIAELAPLLTASPAVVTALLI
jgi:hypothetical protein